MESLNLRSSFQFILFNLFLIIFGLAQGAEIYYDFDVSYFEGAPDGVDARRILGANGQFPGPLIQGVVGDRVVIKVTNNMDTKEDLAMHWHGLYQQGSPFEDGAEFVTQCPIPYGQTQTYNFTFQQFGTYWWHSHVVHQYTEGLFGPIVIKNPNDLTTRSYEEDNEIVLILSDWNHPTGAEVSAWFLSAASEGNEPIPDAGLINGRGTYPCDVAIQNNLTCDPSLQDPSIFWVTRGKTYRFRVINAGGFASFDFSIDGHKMTVIEADGCPAGSKNGGNIVDAFTVAPGQRYSALVEMAGTEGTACYMRSKVRADMFPEGPNINLDPEALAQETLAILQYEDGDSMQKKMAASVGPFQYFPIEYAQQIPRSPIRTLVASNDASPVLLNENDLYHLDGSAPDPVEGEEILQYTLTLDKLVDDYGVTRLVFNNVTYGVPHGSKPLLVLVQNNETLPPSSNPLWVPRLGQIVQIVVNNVDDGGHPLHYHGHDFYVMGKGPEDDGAFDDSKPLNLNPVARDTTFIEANSWLVIRWRSSNPGVWLFHCHMQWHAMGGLQLVVVEAPVEIQQIISVPEETKRVCKLNGIDL